MSSEDVVRFFQALGSTILWSVVAIVLVAVVFEVLDLREMEPEQARRCAVTTPWRPASRPHHEALCPRGTLL